MNEVFNINISARALYEDGKLAMYIVYLDYERFDVAICEIGGLTDAR